MDPEKYPAECSISGDELAKLKEELTRREYWDMYVEEWPPTDLAGNVYPIWFTFDEMDKHGKLTDEHGNPYNPFGGNLQPYDDEYGRCNAPLDHWRTRYPEVRYCGKIMAPFDDDETYCSTHRGRDNVKTAEEQMQTGFYTKSVDHYYEKLDPWKKLVGWGMFESLMGDSSYEYGVEYQERAFDFTDSKYPAPDNATDGVLTVKCGYPTQYGHAAVHLYVAAMQTVQMMSAQSRIMYEDREEGQGMMESKSVEAAQLTAPPSEHDPSPQQFKTLETWGEHHLNLPLSRLIKDQSRLLELGGVEVDPEGESDTADADDIVLEIEANGDHGETTDSGSADPNQFGDDMAPESEKILDGSDD